MIGNKDGDRQTALKVAGLVVKLVMEQYGGGVKESVDQTDKKFTASYGTGGFVALFT